MLPSTLLIYRILFICIAMSTATPHSFGAALATLGGNILQSRSEGILAGVGYIAVFALMVALLLFAVTVYLLRWSMCYV